MILSELIEQPKYAEYMLQEKFSFLKTRNAFMDCMAIAKKRFGWEMGRALGDRSLFQFFLKRF